MTVPSCPLCATDGGPLIYRDALLRVVRVTDTPAHPAFYRVVVNAHVAEFSELVPDDRIRVMDVVVAIEAVLRYALRPAKINLASLGNVVPHLHWHVVARFADDAQFPAPIWSPAVRERPASSIAALQAHLPLLDDAVRRAVQQPDGSQENA